MFVNFGKQADFEWLVANNVTLEGKIALVRYGGNFRGLKAMAAEQHGMVGVLIYSDPKEDGFVQGPVYPEGPWRPEGSFQRGSLTYLSLAAGDPSTPGWASVEGLTIFRTKKWRQSPTSLHYRYRTARHSIFSDLWAARKHLRRGKEAWRCRTATVLAMMKRLW